MIESGWLLPIRVLLFMLTHGVWEIIFPNELPSYRSCLGSFKPSLIEFFAL